jgi:hypothetical protein
MEELFLYSSYPFFLLSAVLFPVSLTAIKSQYLFMLVRFYVFAGKEGQQYYITSTYQLTGPYVNILTAVNSTEN